MKPVLLQNAYVLHRRLYRESSLLVEVFTQDHGRIALIAKGARRSSSSAHGLLQPFLPLVISWTGKSELKTLTHIEVADRQDVQPIKTGYLSGDCLFAGFYINELLLYLLQKHDPHPKLFSVYTETLFALQMSQKLQQKTLRIFEKRLLEEIGYGLLQTYLPDKYYRFIPDHGFEVIEELVSVEVMSSSSHVFSGKHLLAIAKEDLNDENLSDAKRLTRTLLAPLLGTRRLHSRRLFIRTTEEGAT